MIGNPKSSLMINKIPKTTGIYTGENKVVVAELRWVQKRENNIITPLMKCCYINHEDAYFFYVLMITIPHQPRKIRANDMGLISKKEPKNVIIKMITQGFE